MPRTAAARLWEALREQGAEFAFGLPGSQTIEAFQPLKHSGLRTVVPTHEMAAAFMANGYARVAGKPGVLTTIPGPGFTYAPMPDQYMFSALQRLELSKTHRRPLFAEVDTVSSHMPWNRIPLQIGLSAGSPRLC